jgi:hypothetical protein
MADDPDRIVSALPKIDADPEQGRDEEAGDADTSLPYPISSRWWSTANPKRRYSYARLMIILAVVLLIDSIATGSRIWIILSVIFGAVMVDQFRRARNNRAR